MTVRPLTRRQAVVLDAAADGAPLSQVAERLCTTREQIAARLSEAYRRLDVTYLPRGERRAAAVRAARAAGYIPAGPDGSAPERCGNFSPKTVLSPTPVRCVLPPGHDGWHHDDTALQWEPRA